MRARSPGRRTAATCAYALAAVALVAPAAGAARVQLGASSQIVAPTGLSGETRALEASVTRVGAAGGRLVMLPDGTVRAIGDVVLGAEGAPSRAGGLPVTLPPNRHATLRLARGATLTGPGGGLVVTDFTSTAPRAGVLWEGSPDLAVGATIRLPGGLPPGRYAGSFDVTLEND